MQRRLIRIFDVLFSLIALLVLMPVLLLISMLILLSMGAPIFFVQKRLGLKGEVFSVYKYRSMSNVTIEEQDFEKVNEYAVKLKNDPRITPLGNFLRKTSLDELPQFWNVLKGDMSFVGPRPWVPQEYEVIPKDWHSRLSAKPGITGLAQINGRSDLAMDKIVKNDMEWVENQSISNYFLILFRTFAYAFKMKNVY